MQEQVCTGASHMKAYNIYVDCTETVMYRSNSGIKRTVRKLTDVSRLEYEEFTVNIKPIVILYGKIYSYNKDKISKFSNIYYNLTELSIKLRKHLTNDVASSEIKPDKQQKNLCNKLGLVEKILYFIYTLFSKLDGVVRKIEVNEKSILLYADSFWSGWVSDSTGIVSGKKYLVLYDVIPIEHPNFYSADFSEKFINSLDTMLTVVDGVITISKSERENIKSVCREHIIKRNLPIKYNHLGADFTSLVTNYNNVRANIIKAMAQRNVLLMVGAIEPRKNYDYAIDVFEILWNAGADVRLVIIGNQGWKCRDTVQRIRNHPQYGMNLLHFENANDDELSYCYQHSRALVFASIAEGFGLPLVEAMGYGKEVLASDIPIFREIGGDYPRYFPLGNSSAAAKAFSEFVLSPPRVNIARSWMSWDESVKGFYRSVVSMATDS